MFDAELRVLLSDARAEPDSDSDSDSASA
jgi:hypothetical protein